MEISQLLSKSEALTVWIRSKLDNLGIQTDHRSLIAFGCFDLTCEHREGIVLLIYHKLYGPAFALARSVFESFVRGVWLYRHATDQDIEAFREEKLNRTFESLIKDIETLEEFKVGLLSDLKNQGWKALNSYTHTGFQHITRRVKSEALEPNYHDDEIEEILNFSNGIGLFAALHISFLSTNKELPMAILEKVKQTYEA
jgi:hypothetical protein